MIVVDTAAPQWAHRLTQQIQQEIENAWTRALPVFTVATLPPASSASWIGRVVRLTNGTSGKPLAVSNGTNWIYPDGATAA